MGCGFWPISLDSSGFSVSDPMQVILLITTSMVAGVPKNFVDLNDTLKLNFSQVSVQVTCSPEVPSVWQALY